MQAVLGAEGHKSQENGGQEETVSICFNYCCLSSFPDWKRKTPEFRSRLGSEQHGRAEKRVDEESKEEVTAREQSSGMSMNSVYVMRASSLSLAGHS